MPFDPNQLVDPLLLALKPYQPGKPIKECQRELGLKEFIKLASNENPLGCSSKVISGLRNASDIALYPDGAAFELKQAIAGRLNIKASQLILGNGSEDVLRMFIQAFGWDKHEILIPEFAFVAYKILAQGLGIKIKEVPAKHYGLDLDAMFQALSAKTRMIIFANPNNPTGTYVNHQSFVAFMNKLPQQVLVICDEAYYEYVLQKDYPNTIALQNQYPNLIVTRTFSKVYGLAGLRVGYGIADEKIIDLVNRLRQPFNVNHLAQIAAKLALQDQEFVKKSILTNEQGKKQLIEGLNKLGLRFIQGEGNFVCTQIPLAHVDVFQAMLKQGVIIRPLAPYKMDNFYRITIGTFEQNQACLKALGMILHKEKII